MVFDFLLWQGLVVGYVIVYYRAQKFIELLVGSDVFKGYTFNGEAVVFLHVLSASVFQNMIWFRSSVNYKFFKGKKYIFAFFWLCLKNIEILLLI